MKKILITGGNGQLGRQFQVLSKNYKEFDFLFTDLPELDITNHDLVDEFLQKYQPDWMINCAAYTAVDKAESDSNTANQINSDAPALLAKLTDKYKCRLVHISTDYVFGGDANTPYNENHPKMPEGVYAQSKSLGEDLVLANNPKAIIVRTSWLYSEFGVNFMKTVIRICSESGKMRVVSDQTGTPTWAGDLAKAIMALIKKEINPGVYHFSNEGVCSWYDFAKAIVEIKKFNCVIEPIDTSEYPTAAQRPYYSVLDKSLFKEVTGVKIPWWYDSLKQCINEMDHS